MPSKSNVLLLPADNVECFINMFCALQILQDCPHQSDTFYQQASAREFKLKRKTIIMLGLYTQKKTDETGGTPIIQNKCACVCVCMCNRRVRGGKVEEERRKGGKRGKINQKLLTTQRIQRIH